MNANDLAGQTLGENLLPEPPAPSPIPTQAQPTAPVAPLAPLQALQGAAPAPSRVLSPFEAETGTYDSSMGGLLPIAPGQTILGTEKYDRYHFDNDNPEIRAQSQGAFELGVKASVQTVGMFGSMIVQGAGFLAASSKFLYDVLSNGSWEKAKMNWENPLIVAGDEVNEFFREIAPIYETAKAADGGWDGTRIASGIPSIASTAAMFVPGFGAAAAVRALSTAAKVARFGRVARGLEVAGGALANRHFSNMMEAAGTYADRKDFMVAKLRSENPDMPDAEIEALADANARQAANTVYKAGIPLLVLDIFQMSSMLKMGRANPFTRALAQDVTEMGAKEGAEQVFVNAAKKVINADSPGYLKAVTPLTGLKRAKSVAGIGLTEGAEEVWIALANANANYHADMSAGIPRYSRNLKDIITENIFEREAVDGFIFGMLGGTAMAGASGSVKLLKDLLGEEQAKKQYASYNAFVRRSKELVRQTSELEVLRNQLADESLSPAKRAAINTQIAEIREKNLSSDLVLDTADTTLAMLRELKEQATSDPEVFAKAVESEINLNNLDELIQIYEKGVTDFQKAYKTVNASAGMFSGINESVIRHVSANIVRKQQQIATAENNLSGLQNELDAQLDGYTLNDKQQIQRNLEEVGLMQTKVYIQSQIQRLMQLKERAMSQEEVNARLSVSPDTVLDADGAVQSKQDIEREIASWNEALGRVEGELDLRNQERADMDAQQLKQFEKERDGHAMEFVELFDTAAATVLMGMQVSKAKADLQSMLEPDELKKALKAFKEASKADRERREKAFKEAVENMEKAAKQTAKTEEAKSTVSKARKTLILERKDPVTGATESVIAEPVDPESENSLYTIKYWNEGDGIWEYQRDITDVDNYESLTPSERLALPAVEVSRETLELNYVPVDLLTPLPGNNAQRQSMQIVKDTVMREGAKYKLLDAQGNPDKSAPFYTEVGADGKPVAGAAKMDRVTQQLYGKDNNVDNKRKSASREIGTEVDTLMRMFVIDPSAEVDLKKFTYMDKENVEAVRGIAYQLRLVMASKGHRMVSADEILIVDHRYRLAGTLDLLTVDPSGRLHVWDYKTTSSADLDSSGSSFGKFKQIYTNQINAYANMLMGNYGVEVSEEGAHLIPIVVEHIKSGSRIDGVKAVYWKETAHVRSNRPVQLKGKTSQGRWLHPLPGILWIDGNPNLKGFETFGEPSDTPAPVNTNNDDNKPLEPDPETALNSGVYWVAKFRSDTGEWVDVSGVVLLDGSLHGTNPDTGKVVDFRSLGSRLSEVSAAKDVPAQYIPGVTASLMFVGDDSQGSQEFLLMQRSPGGLRVGMTFTLVMDPSRASSKAKPYLHLPIVSMPDGSFAFHDPASGKHHPVDPLELSIQARHGDATAYVGAPKQKTDWREGERQSYSMYMAMMHNRLLEEGSVDVVLAESKYHHSEGSGMKKLAPLQPRDPKEQADFKRRQASGELTVDELSYVNPIDVLLGYAGADLNNLSVVKANSLQNAQGETAKPISLTLSDGSLTIPVIMPNGLTDHIWVHSTLFNPRQAEDIVTALQLRQDSPVAEVPGTGMSAIEMLETFLFLPPAKKDDEGNVQVSSYKAVIDGEFIEFSNVNRNGQRQVERFNINRDVEAIIDFLVSKVRINVKGTYLSSFPLAGRQITFGGVSIKLGTHAGSYHQMLYEMKALVTNVQPDSYGNYYSMPSTALSLPMSGIPTPAEAKEPVKQALAKKPETNPKKVRKQNSKAEPVRKPKAAKSQKAPSDVQPTGNAVIDNAVVRPSDIDRFRVSSDIEPFQPIDLQAEMAWLRRTLPNVPVSVIDELIRIADKGETAWGLFGRSGIVLSRKGARGTLYHEAFHAVMTLMLTKAEQQQLLQEARQLFGAKRNRDGSEVDYHEELAEAFRLYVQRREQVRSSRWAITNFMADMFERIWLTISSIFPGNRLTVNRLFRSIDSGKLRRRDVDMNLISSMDDMYRKVGQFNGQETSEIVDGFIRHMLHREFDQPSEQSKFDELDVFDFSDVGSYLKTAMTVALNSGRQDLADKYLDLATEQNLQNFVWAVSEKLKGLGLVQQTGNQTLELSWDPDPSDLADAVESGDLQVSAGTVVIPVYKFDPKTRARAYVRVYLATIDKVSEDGKPIRGLTMNRLLESQATMFNGIAYNLKDRNYSGNGGLDRFMQDLKDLANLDPRYAQVYRDVSKWSTYRKKTFMQAFWMSDQKHSVVRNDPRKREYLRFEAGMETAIRQRMDHWRANFTMPSDNSRFFQVKGDSIHVRMEAFRHIQDRFNTFRAEVSNTPVHYKRDAKQQAELQAKLEVWENEFIAILNLVGIEFDRKALKHWYWDNEAYSRITNAPDADPEVERFEETASRVRILSQMSTSLNDIGGMFNRKGEPKYDYSINQILLKYSGRILDVKHLLDHTPISRRNVGSLARAYSLAYPETIPNTTYGKEAIYAMTLHNSLSQTMSKLNDPADPLRAHLASQAGTRRNLFVERKGQSKAADIYFDTQTVLDVKGQRRSGMDHADFDPLTKLLNEMSNFYLSGGVPMLNMSDKKELHHILGLFSGLSRKESGEFSYDPVMRTVSMNSKTGEMVLSPNSDAQTAVIKLVADEIDRINAVKTDLKGKGKRIKGMHIPYGKDSKTGADFILFPNLEKSRLTSSNPELARLLYPDGELISQTVSGDVDVLLDSPAMRQWAGQFLKDLAMDGIVRAAELGLDPSNREMRLMMHRPALEMMAANRVTKDVEAAEVMAAQDMIANFTIASYLGYMNQLGAFYGDVSFAKSLADFRKRTSGLKAYGTGLIVDQPGQRYAGQGANTHFGVIVVKDVVRTNEDWIEQLRQGLLSSNSKLSAKRVEEIVQLYRNIKATDGFSFMTLDRWYDIMKGLGRDSAAVTRLYHKLQDPKAVPTGEEAKLLNTFKGVYHGNTMMDLPSGPRLARTYLKYAQGVLYPGLVQGTPLQAPYEAAKRLGVDEIVFADSVKEGTVEPADLYDVSTWKQIMMLDNSNWRLQVETGHKGFGERALLSQPKRNVVSQMDMTDPRQRNLFNFLQQLERVLSDSGVSEFMDKMGAEIVDGKVAITDRKAAGKLLSRAVKQRATENERQAIETLSEDDGVKNIDGLGDTERLQQLILSESKDSAVKIKAFGGAMIQVPFAGMWAANDRIKMLIDPDSDGKYDLLGPRPEFDSSGNLVRIKPGQIMISWPFKDIPYDSVSQEQIRSMLKGSGVLEIVGLRVPNQDLPSMDHMEIVGFLPPETDSIIVYDGFTVKTDSDFDIDKLYLMMHNYKVEHRGKPEAAIRKYLFRSIPSDPSTTIVSESQATAFVDKWHKDLDAEERSAKISSLMGTSLYDPIVNSKKAVQNAYVDAFVEVLSHPVNYERRMTALSDGVGQIKDYISENVPDLSRYEEFSWMTQFDLTELFLSGKANIGIVANHLIEFMYNQIVPVQMLGYDPRQGSSRFHNFDKRKDDDQGRYISVNINILMSGFVDVSKDPFLAKANINSYTLPMVLYLLRFGYTLEKVIDFTTSEVVRQYTNEVSQSESKLLQNASGRYRSKKEILEDLREKYGKVEDKAPVTLDQAMTDKASMVEVIDRMSSSAEALNQLATLHKYYVNGAGKNFREVAATRRRIDNALASKMFKGIKERMELSSLSTIFHNSVEVPMAIGSHFFMEATKGYHDLLDSLIGLIIPRASEFRKEAIIEILSKELSSFLRAQSSMHPTREQMQELLKQKTESGKTIHDLLEQAKARAPHIRTMPLIQLLNIGYDTDNDLIQVSFNDGELDIDGKDRITENWEELLMDPNTWEFAEALVKVAIGTSAWQYSLNSFHSLIPTGYLMTVTSEGVPSHAASLDQVHQKLMEMDHAFMTSVKEKAIEQILRNTVESVSELVESPLPKYADEQLKPGLPGLIQYTLNKSAPFLKQYAAEKKAGKPITAVKPELMYFPETGTFELSPTKTMDMDKRLPDYYKIYMNGEAVLMKVIGKNVAPNAEERVDNTIILYPVPKMGMYNSGYTVHEYYPVSDMDVNGLAQSLYHEAYPDTKPIEQVRQIYGDRFRPVEYSSQSEPRSALSTQLRHGVLSDDVITEHSENLKHC